MSTPACKKDLITSVFLEDDKEYIQEIIKASHWGMADYLINYFVMLMITDSMARPEVVWEKTWYLLAQDVEQTERIKKKPTRY